MRKQPPMPTALTTSVVMPLQVDAKKLALASQQVCDTLSSVQPVLINVINVLSVTDYLPLSLEELPSDVVEQLQATLTNVQSALDALKSLEVPLDAFLAQKKSPHVSSIANVVLASVKQNPLAPILLPLFGDQDQAVTDILTWARDLDDCPFYVLRGYAGTGKSTLMTHVVYELGELAVPTALTNKAARVLRSMLAAANLPEADSTTTIYSVLKLVMKQEEDKLVLSKAEGSVYDEPVRAGTVFIVDECSMINKELLKEIKDYARRHRVKFLFVGDPFQVNPVGEGRSQVWKLDAPGTQLTQIRRFDSSLLSLSTEIRRRIKEKEYSSDGLFIPSDEIKILSSTKFMNKVCEKFTETKGQDKDIRVIAWTNRRLNDYNRAIRRSLNHQGDYVPNDLLMMAAPVHETTPNPYASSRFAPTVKKIVSTIDDEATVSAVEETHMAIDFYDSTERLDAYKLTVAGDYNGYLYLPVDEAAFEDKLSDLANTARNALGRERAKRWKAFWDARETFHKVRFGWALTVHRAQGSTYREAFVDATNIASNPNGRERMKILYVGASRASSLLYVRH